MNIAACVSGAALALLATVPLRGGNGALEFAGSQLVAIPHGPAFAFRDEVTVEGWVQPFAFPTYNTLLRKNIAFFEDNYNLRICIDNAVEFNCKIDGGVVRFGASFSFQARRWYHLAGTFDGRYLRIYVDGELVGEREAPGRLADDPVTTYVGHGDGDWFIGRIDEVRLWKVARSAREIQETMHTGIPRDHPDLVGWWRFDEPDGQRVLDSSPNGLDGTLGEDENPGPDDPVRVPSDAPLSCITAEKIEPAIVPTAGGTVTVFGEDLAGHGELEVLIEGIAVPILEVTGESLRAVASAHEDGTVDVVIRAPCGDAILRLEYRSLFVRGDANGDGLTNISDAVAILYYLFGGRRLSCADAADVNDTGDVELGDAMGLLMYLFAGGFPPPPPFPERGPDPSADSIGCGR